MKCLAYALGDGNRGGGRHDRQNEINTVSHPLIIVDHLEAVAANPVGARGTARARPRMLASESLGAALAASRAHGLACSLQSL
jgi:hypothetical protein